METRPKIEIDPAKVEALAARGLSMAKIADSLGISERTLYNRQKDNAELAAAIKKGRAKGETIIADKLFEAAKGGNVTAMIFYLKSRCGWSEKQEVEVTGSVSPQIVFIENVPD